MSNQIVQKAQRNVKRRKILDRLHKKGYTFFIRNLTRVKRELTMQKRMSLEEISEEINISRTTIYKVINNKGYVTENTRKKVEKALEKYHYVPNYNARDLARNREYIIGYVGILHLSPYFARTAVKGLERAQEEFRDHGLKLVIRESEFLEPEKQPEQLQELYDEGIRNIIIAVAKSSVVRDKVNELRGLGCNIVYLNRYVEEEHRIYVGPDYYQSGRVAGELMGKLLPGGGQILVLLTNSMEIDSAVKDRCEGFIQESGKYQGLEIVSVVENINSDRQAVECVEDYMKEYPNLAGIYDVSYKLASVAEMVWNKGIGGSIRLIGFDCYEEVVPYLRNSTVDAVVSQDLVGQAYLAAKSLFEQMCYGREFEKKDHYAKLGIVMSTNVDYYGDY